MKWLILGLDETSSTTLRKLTPKNRERLIENKTFLEEQMTKREIERAQTQAEKYIIENLAAT